ncbi:hypothetical protein [Citricoccus sp. NR2]|uniref:hypothetical protein n=1 Tax=Citricoccus sp. NR2 TaxID=3004095 RepID=UPI0022DE21D4|nr:hypothetical protein [Citricoccus sp. NR2]WBL18526.1 hypothetical protein O1A05_12265 [Citricoccus sp. NR2]
MSELLKIFEIQTDEQLRHRTQGAVIEHALSITAGPAPEPTVTVTEDEDGEQVETVTAPPRDPARNYARFVLDSPTTVRPEMVERVIANPTVLAAIDYTGGTWDTSTVADDDIRYVVHSAWDDVAEVLG